jgi:hypothetical protein
MASLSHVRLFHSLGGLPDCLNNVTSSDGVDCHSSLVSTAPRRRRTQHTDVTARGEGGTARHSLSLRSPRQY